MIVASEEDLRKPAEKVALEAGKEIISILTRELEKSEIGVGLAAPQIGIPARVFVMKGTNGIKGFINPEITLQHSPFLNKREGCLSFPGVWINTVRYHHVEVKDDLHGETVIENFGAVVAQHEIDHLEGILFFDRKAPDKYDYCFCGSDKKFKFCCMKKVNE